jgi:hypothetical protein
MTCTKEKTSWLTLINDSCWLLRHVEIYGLSLESKQEGGNKDTT